MEGVIDSALSVTDWHAGAIALCGYDGASASPEVPNKGTQKPEEKENKCSVWTLPRAALDTVHAATFGSLAVTETVAGGMLIGAGCANPAGPATCGAAVFGGVSLVGAGVGSGWIAYKMAQKVIIPEVNEAMTCKP